MDKLTKEKLKAQYIHAEDRFDRLLVRFASNPVTLALFVAWTILAVLAGVWVS